MSDITIRRRDVGTPAGYFIYGNYGEVLYKGKRIGIVSRDNRFHLEMLYRGVRKVDSTSCLRDNRGLGLMELLQMHVSNIDKMTPADKRKLNGFEIDPRTKRGREIAERDVEYKARRMRFWKERGLTW